MIEPVVKEVWVPASVEDAFRRFTEEIATWWPTEKHSVSEGDCRDVRFEGKVGGSLMERAMDGTRHPWGTVKAWDPPARVAFTWHPGRSPDTAQEVEVTFAQAGDGTRVRLVHSGWEVLGDSAEKVRAGYEQGWTGVLEQYVAALA